MAMDELLKACDDYSSVGIGRGSSYETGTAMHHINRDGRRVFSTSSSYKAAMFAEELYERITLARAHTADATTGSREGG